MPKKLFAVTNVKTSLPGQDASFFAANTEIDPSKFTKEQLVELHEAGAVEIRIVEEDTVAAPEVSDVLNPVGEVQPDGSSEASN